MGMLKRLALAAPQMIRDGAGLAGVGLIAYGSWLVLPAAGYIVGGFLLVAGAWLHARASN
jgi:hypothetical protein